MNNEQEKKLKELLRSEFLPLFVGLRSELKNVGEHLQSIKDKPFPDVQRTEITNQPEKLKELAISNLPDVQKSKITNFPAPIKELEVKDIAVHLQGVVKSIGIALNDLKTFIGGAIGDARNNIIKVDVQNNQPFPKSIKIENLGDIKQPEPPVIPDSVFIKNFAPHEAIPVVLTKHDRRQFYEAFSQMYIANDVNLERVIKAIQDVTVDIGEINVDLDDVEALITITNTLLSSILAALGGAVGTITLFGELLVTATTEDTIISYTCPVGKTFDLTGAYAEGDDDGIFRLYKNATKIWQSRNAWTERSVQTKEVSVHLVPADVLFLKVFNTKGASRNYSGGIYGNEI